MLKYKMTRLVWESDLQDLIVATYGRRTEWAAEQEMGQNETRDFTVPQTRWVMDSEVDDFEQWLDGSNVYGVSMQLILNDLHDRGLVEAGDYTIEVWW